LPAVPVSETRPSPKQRNPKRRNRRPSTPTVEGSRTWDRCTRIAERQARRTGRSPSDRRSSLPTAVLIAVPSREGDSRLDHVDPPCVHRLYSWYPTPRRRRRSLSADRIRIECRERLPSRAANRNWDIQMSDPVAAAGRRHQSAPAGTSRRSPCVGSAPTSPGAFPRTGIGVRWDIRRRPSRSVASRV
jgi:hypothetical protein